MTDDAREPTPRERAEAWLARAEREQANVMDVGHRAQVDALIGLGWAVVGLQWWEPLELQEAPADD